MTLEALRAVRELRGRRPCWGKDKLTMTMVATMETNVPAKPSEGAVKRSEYQVERMPLQEHPEEHISDLVERLNELG